MPPKPRRNAPQPAKRARGGQDSKTMPDEVEETKVEISESDTSEEEASDDDKRGSDEEEEEEEEGQNEEAQSDAEEQDAVAKKPTKKKGKAAEKLTATQLFDTLYSRKTAVEEEANEWISFYKRDDENALAVLINGIMRMCGCKGPDITLEQFKEDEVATLVESMEDMFEGAADDYPIVGQGKTGKKFASRLADFWIKLLTKMQNSVLFEAAVMDELVKVHADIDERMNEVQRQLDAKAKKSAARTAELNKDRTRYHDHIMALQEWFKELFQGVFLPRFRDTAPIIRQECIKSLGGWMASLPFFVEDQYLKYIGWLFSDTDAGVRLHALEALHELYADNERWPMLESFTERFKARIVEMTNDVDPTVAAKAVQVAARLLEQGVLEEKDVQAIYELADSYSPAIRHATGAFIFRNALADLEEEDTDEKKTKQALLRRIVEVHMDIGTEDASGLVDSLWDQVEVLKDWKTMCDMLMARKSSGMSDDEETALVRLLCASMRRGVGKSRYCSPEHIKLSNREKEMRSQSTANVTEICAKTLPKLLERFTGDERKISYLVAMPQLVNGELFATHHIKDTEALVRPMADAISKYANGRLLESCAQSLRALRQVPALAKSVDARVAVLADDLETRLDECWLQFEKSPADADIGAGLRGLMARIAMLYRYLDLSERDMLNRLVACIIDDSTNDDSEVDQETAAMAVEVIQQCLAWQLLHFGDHAQSKDQATVGLKLRVNAFASQLEALVRSNKPAVQYQAYLSLMSVVTMFSQSLRTTDLRPLAYRPDGDMAASCRQYVLDLISGEAAGDIDAGFKADTWAALYGEENEDGDDSGLDDSDFQDRKRKNRARILLASFLAACAHDGLSYLFGAPFLAYYFDETLGDTVKKYLQELRHADHERSPQVMLAYLQQEYSSRVANGTDDDVSDLRELAHRLSQTFGVDAANTAAARERRDKARMGRRFLHQEAIKWSLEVTADDDEPKHVGFLRILGEFSVRLNPVDAKQILEYTVKRSERLPDADLPALRSFKELLQRVADGRKPESRKDGAHRRAAAKAQSRRNVDDPIESDDESLKSDTPAVKKRKAAKAQPASPGPGGWMSKPTGDSARKSVKRSRVSVGEARPQIRGGSTKSSPTESQRPQRAAKRAKSMRDLSDSEGDDE